MCKEGAKSLSQGNLTGSQHTVLTGPASSLSGRGGSFLDGIGGFGGTGGGPWIATCPDNKKFVGMDVKNGTYISQLKPYCA